LCIGRGTVNAFAETIGATGDDKTTTEVAKSTKLPAKVTRVDGAVASTRSPPSARERAGGGRRPRPP
jgi:hypothetical protein